MNSTTNDRSAKQGRNGVNLRGGAGVFVIGRIVHGLSPSVKCVAPLFRDIP